MPRLRLPGLAEVAELLGVSKRSASRYTQQTDFPVPLARLAAGPIWDADAVKDWAAENGPFLPPGLLPFGHASRPRDGASIEK